MIEHPGLEVVKRQPKTKILENNLIHGERILSELREDASVTHWPHYFKISLKSFLSTTALDNGISSSVAIVVH